MPISTSVVCSSIKAASVYLGFLFSFSFFRFRLGKSPFFFWKTSLQACICLCCEGLEMENVCQILRSTKRSTASDDITAGTSATAKNFWIYEANCCMYSFQYYLISTSKIQIFQWRGHNFINVFSSLAALASMHVCNQVVSEPQTAAQGGMTCMSTKSECDECRKKRLFLAGCVLEISSTIITTKPFIPGI